MSQNTSLLSSFHFGQGRLFASLFTAHMSKCGDVREIFVPCEGGNKTYRMDHNWSFANITLTWNDMTNQS